MQVRCALGADLLQIASLLKRSGLASSDYPEHLDDFVVVTVLDKIIGTGGLEIYGDVALVRSIAVLDEYRGRDIGGVIYRELQAKAVYKRVKALYLLTETAADYFKARHFSVIDRDLAPQKIQQTKQFSSLCPASATVMRHIL